MKGERELGFGNCISRRWDMNKFWDEISLNLNLCGSIASQIKELTLQLKFS